MVKFRKLFGSSKQKELQEKPSNKARLESLELDRKTKNDLVEKTQESLEKKQSELEAKASELEKLYEQNENSRSFTGDRKQLQKQIAETEKKHAVLEEEVATLTKRLSKLKTDLGKIDTAIEKAGGPKSTAILGDKAQLSPLLKAYTDKFGDKYGKPEETTNAKGQKVTILKFGSKEEAMQFFEEQAKAGHSFKLLDAEGNVTHEAKGGKFTEVKATAMKPVEGTSPRSEHAPEGYDSPRSSSPSRESPEPTRRGPSPIGGG